MRNGNNARGRAPGQEHHASPQHPPVCTPHPSRSIIKRLFTQKRLLSLGLALLLILVLLGIRFLLLPRPTTRWTFHPGALPFGEFSPIESHGLVYTFVTTGSYTVIYALDANSGQLRWSIDLEGVTISDTPLVANGSIYVLTDDTTADKQSTLYALDATSGRTQWSYQQIALSQPTISNGMVYLHSSDGNLYALDALSGHHLWSAPVGDGDFTIPVVANNLVYIAAENQAKTASTVFALDAISGAKTWSAVEEAPLIGQLAVANGLVYLSADGPAAQVWALGALSGKPIWDAQPARPSALTTIVFAALSFQVVNGMAYVDYAQADLNGLTGPNTLYALDVRTGRQVWTAQTVSPEPTIANGTVYIYSGNVFSSGGGLICSYPPCPSAPYPDGAGNGTLSALDARSGRQEWSHQAVPFIDQSLTFEPKPAVVDGTVYIWTTKSNKDTLYALNAASGSEQWSYQTGGAFSAPPMVVDSIVYASLNDTLEAIQPPGGPPGFSW